VVGLFLYATDERELDVEFATWGGSRRDNSQYVVQPPFPAPDFYNATNLQSFFFNNTATSHHAIQWSYGKVARPLWLQA
jgi:hypothetical protein